MRITRLLVGLLALVALVGASTFIGRPAAAKDTGGPNTISAELIGQVLNPSPSLSAQYGYVSFLHGVDASAITAGGGALSEQTAMLTFYNHTTVDRVINNGPMRTIDRSGEATFYFNPAPAGNFAQPESLRQGAIAMTATLRHQVVVDTLTGAFTAHFDCVVAESEPVSIGGARYRLGKPGDRFEITFQGHLNTPAPPSGYMAGYITGLELQPMGR
jgi:hypothetical protein